MQSTNTFISGFGKHYTNNPDKIGKACYHANFIEIDTIDIEKMLATPQAVNKSDAQWAIFSNLQSRVHAEQRQNGLYSALWCDIDDTSLSIDELTDKLNSIVNGCLFYTYTSRSNTVETPKYRGIIPLSIAVAGGEYELLQAILNDKLSGLNITPDRATERAAQPCYLPNQGECYEYRISNKSNEKLSPKSWNDELNEKRLAKEKQQHQIEQDKQNAIAKRAQCIAGGSSVIDAFNQSHSIELCFSMYGYTKLSGRWLSPLSQSKSPAVTIKDNKWLSHHGSDIDHGVGSLSSDGTCCFGDAFDLAVFYEYQNDRNTALKELGNSLHNSEGVSLNKANQREYMAQNEQMSTIAQFEKIAANAPIFDLTQFSLNGSSKEMESKMLDDKFVLGRMAILGQATAIYAKPNAGKTLMTLWLLIDAIQRDEIEGNKVFYINADDNHKGLVYKLKLAEKHGFHMLAPSYNGFNSNDFLPMLNTIIQQDTASGTVIILDTLKKFTDVMDKKIGSEFGKVVRAFVSNGGTVIMLAHTNKHRDGDGKVIFSGTSDIVDDIDCAYTLDTTSEDPFNKTVTFENFKSRGDVIKEIAYSYSATEGQDYYELLHSIEPVDEARADKLKAQRLIDEKLVKNELIIEAVLELLSEGINSKTELAEGVRKNTGESLKKVHNVLKAHEGHNFLKGDRWHVSKVEKNKHVYLVTHVFDNASTDYKRAKEG
ncbi:AAA family ATPase [Pseudocolwellia agarivorans]|uniref:AAA family ATPase n=1 Tax=Pseudocolwellia agarivorans TaxID=1911682 RepID=UPI0009870BC4|nr:AAA family ATPase [Pseudocolwellia agarivorans]